ncbi:hypothetical protein C2G38_2158247 [Gigaspora rosea]|uniref:Uncharacterized protein n=1 Tax=Gigaspora rosea TaxID=44941 RepID=A0A397W4P4_9GLOM|nr:hypothetical protein C2G38_2158247 [Gigaspora rosea]
MSKTDKVGYRCGIRCTEENNNNNNNNKRTAIKFLYNVGCGDLENFTNGFFFSRMSPGIDIREPELLKKDNFFSVGSCLAKVLGMMVWESGTDSCFARYWNSGRNGDSGTEIGAKRQTSARMAIRGPELYRKGSISLGTVNEIRGTRTGIKKQDTGNRDFEIGAGTERKALVRIFTKVLEWHQEVREPELLQKDKY